MQLILEIWNLLQAQDPQGTRFAVLYKHLDLQDEEAWAFVRSLPQDELVLLRQYAEKQVQPQQVLPTTDFPAHSATWLSIRALSQSEEQSRRRHTLECLLQL